MKPHRWKTSKHAKWLTYCRCCGLLVLNNAVTLKAMKAGCKDNMDD